MPRGLSVPVSTYGAQSDFFRLVGRAAVNRQLLEFWLHPFGRFSTFGLSSIESTPFHSVAGLLPSTGRFQSNDVLRLGMKFEKKKAMFPSLSANTVLLDEFVCSSIVSRNER